MDQERRRTTWRAKHLWPASRLAGMENALRPTSAPTSASGRRTRRAARASKLVNLLAIVPCGLIAFATFATVVPPRSGPLALAMIFESQLFIAVLVVLTPIALLARARFLATALLVTLIAGAGMFGSEWVSLPGDGGSRNDLSVMTWNLQYGTRTPAETAAELEGVTADVIALQELEPGPAIAIDADPAIRARYPYRKMAPLPGASGLAILSRYPIAKAQVAFAPSIIDVVLETPRGRVTVINSHPSRATIVTVTSLRIPIGYHPGVRDAEIAAIRGRIKTSLVNGERLLVVGDYNTSPSEASYAVLTKGLRDTAVQVGEGPQWTWRPSRIDFLPLGFLRIDLQLTAGAIVPVSTSTDCSLAGDHCRLFGDYQING